MPQNYKKIYMPVKEQYNRLKPAVVYGSTRTMRRCVPPLNGLFLLQREPNFRTPDIIFGKGLLSMVFKNRCRKMECNMFQSELCSRVPFIKGLMVPTILKTPFLTAYVALQSPRCQEF
jgi:hypothetical protein